MPKLKQARESLHLSLKYAARTAGMSAIRLSELERGHCVPTPGELAALGELYGVDGDKLMRGSSLVLPERYEGLASGLCSEDRAALACLVRIKQHLKG